MLYNRRDDRTPAMGLVQRFRSSNQMEPASNSRFHCRKVKGPSDKFQGIGRLGRAKTQRATARVEYFKVIGACES
jgi:hypothetical protein